MGDKPILSATAQNLVCITLDVHIWSGRRVLDKTDLIRANPEFAKLPEKELANLGSVKICDPEIIKTFNRLKNKAIFVLERAGLPVAKAIGVPEISYPPVYDQLVEIEGEYNGLAAQFVNNFDQSVADWKLKHLLKNPEWESLFRNLPTAAQVGGKISFDFHPVKIGPPSAQSDRPELNAKFEKGVGGLKGELLTEVAKEADAFVTSLFATDKAGVTKKREYVTPKTLGPLQRAAAKLSAFSFIDPEIGPLSDLLSELLLDMPDQGRIDGQKLLMLASVARMMLDQKGITNLSSIAFNGGSASDIVVRTDVVNTNTASDMSDPMDDLMPDTASLTPQIKPQSEFDAVDALSASVPNQAPAAAATEEMDLCALL